MSLFNILHLASRSQQRQTPNLGFRLVLLTLLLSLIACSSLDRPCNKDDDCDWGFYCRSDKICKSGCRFSIECKTKEVCSANKCAPVLNDADEDGFVSPFDCDDRNPLINPGMQEICKNEIDDNCDKRIDEVGCVLVDCRPGSIRSCYDGKERTLTFTKTLCKKGTQACNSQGSWEDCQGQILPSPEDCDNLDNDCDGKLDEDEKNHPLSRSCYTAQPGTQNIGVCKTGKQSCTKGKWGICKGENKPSKERCDGKDNDCNGLLDDVAGKSESCTTNRSGLCKQGKKLCDLKQKKLICKALQEAQKENCSDQIDNDCDGKINNGCPHYPRKKGSLSSFPKAIAMSDKYVVIGIKTPPQVAIYSLTSPSKKPILISLSEEPYGVAVNGNSAFVVGSQKIYKIEITTQKTTLFTKLPQPSHQGRLQLLGGRLYTRYIGKNKNSQTTLGICRIELSNRQVNCAEIKQQSQKLGYGLEFWKSNALILSDRGIHQIEILSLQEDTTRQISLTTGIEHLAFDNKTEKLIVTNPNKKLFYLVDLYQKKAIARVYLKDDKGNPQKPGGVVAADGIAYISHRDGDKVSVYDLQQQKFTHHLKVGRAPSSLVIGSYIPKVGRQVWVSCPGDNTIWSFLSP